MSWVLSLVHFAAGATGATLGGGGRGSRREVVEHGAQRGQIRGRPAGQEEDV